MIKSLAFYFCCKQNTNITSDLDKEQTNQATPFTSPKTPHKQPAQAPGTSLQEQSGPPLNQDKNQQEQTDEDQSLFSDDDDNEIQQINSDLRARAVRNLKQENKLSLAKKS